MSKLLQDVLVRMNNVWGGWSLPSGSTSYSDIEWYDASTAPTEADFNAKLAELTPIIAMDALRSHRNDLLKESDWSQTPDIPDSVKLAWQPYRQDLRDLPANNPTATIEDGRLINVIWPTKPE